MANNFQQRDEGKLLGGESLVAVFCPVGQEMSMAGPRPTRGGSMQFARKLRRLRPTDGPLPSPLPQCWLRSG